MKSVLTHKLSLFLLGFLAILLLVVLINFLIIKYNGRPVPAPSTPRAAEVYGKGTPLIYVILGDSTTVAQGGEYDKGYARVTARYLADQGHEVTFFNVGVSGARAKDVADKQTPQAAAVRPDVVLIAVGANDVTHLTNPSDVRTSLSKSIDALRTANKDVKIILTGSPDMGTVPRFPQPTRFLMGQRTRQINAMVVDLAKEKNVIFAPIAEKTGPIFAAHHELYAQDNFHPNRGGYDTWTPVLTTALTQAITKQ
ncbi:MAG: lysophospholipase L1-like esterase [Candidatus Saccharibacteria bacterium]|nr:lysophospholipase L1-like esterase [Candidatus Saccharibacteria bacterium]